ncbi:MAG TPA: DUF6049 family protein, partial [Microthrixaceae bacterium]|nr:DUF6049 family protein [Microthrixaceae bacterium]
SQGSASILRLPFVALDLGGLANAGATATLRQQLQLGTRVVSSVDRNELKSSTWALDDTVTNEALPMIKAEGFTDVVLPVSRFELDDNLNPELIMTGPVQLDGPGELRAIAYDDLVSQQLSDPSVDPAIRAHDALVVLMANWFSANRDNSRLSAPTAVIVVPATTDPAVISTISSALAGAGPLQAAKGTSLLPPASPSIEEPRTRLTFRPSPDVNRLVADSSESQRQINAVKSMAGSAEPAIETWEFLNAETFSLGMSTEQRLSRHYSIRDQVSLKLGAIEPPAARRVVLAAREATIPLRFRNGLPYEVRLTVRARSPRLDVRFKSSDEVVLQPGENQIDLPVEVQAPGESLLRVQLMTPDGGMVLSSFDIPVRSTSISGVGSALSIISITFLLVWWIRTMRRRRREAARESSSHPSTADAPVSEESSTGTVDESG